MQCVKKSFSNKVRSQNKTLQNIKSGSYIRLLALKLSSLPYILKKKSNSLLDYRYSDWHVDLLFLLLWHMHVFKNKCIKLNMQGIVCGGGTVKQGENYAVALWKIKLVEVPQEKYFNICICEKKLAWGWFEEFKC